MVPVVVGYLPGARTFWVFARSIYTELVAEVTFNGLKGTNFLIVE